jgi:hypothetical protein
MHTKQKRSVQNGHGLDIHLLSRCQFPRKSASPAGRYRCPIGRRRAVNLLENQLPSSDRPQFRLSDSFKWRPCSWHREVGNRHLEIYSEGCIRERFLCGCLSRKGKRRVNPRQILTPSYRKSIVSSSLGRNTGLELRCNARRLIHSELNDSKETVGLIV